MNKTEFIETFRKLKELDCMLEAILNCPLDGVFVVERVTEIEIRVVENNETT